MDNLKFGHNWADVPEVSCAWGARWIFPDDQLHDRTDNYGPREQWQELYQWLTKVVGRQPFEMAEKIASVMMTYPNVPYVLFEDDEGKFVGHPHGASGYLYVRAWLRKHEVKPTPMPVVARAIVDEMIDRPFG